MNFNNVYRDHISHLIEAGSMNTIQSFAEEFFLRNRNAPWMASILKTYSSGKPADFNVNLFPQPVLTEIINAYNVSGVQERFNKKGIFNKFIKLVAEYGENYLRTERVKALKKEPTTSQQGATTQPKVPIEDSSVYTPQEFANNYVGSLFDNRAFEQLVNLKSVGTNTNDIVNNAEVKAFISDFITAYNSEFNQTISPVQAATLLLKTDKVSTYVKSEKELKKSNDALQKNTEDSITILVPEADTRGMAVLDDAGQPVKQKKPFAKAFVKELVHEYIDLQNVSGTKNIISNFVATRLLSVVSMCVDKNILAPSFLDDIKSNWSNAFQKLWVISIVSSPAAVSIQNDILSKKEKEEENNREIKNKELSNIKSKYISLRADVVKEAMDNKINTTDDGEYSYPENFKPSKLMQAHLEIIKTIKACRNQIGDSQDNLVAEFAKVLNEEIIYDIDTKEGTVPSINPGDNEIINQLKKISIDGEQLSIAIIQVEELAEKDKERSNQGQETDEQCIKRVEEQFEKIKKDYESLMNSKDTKDLFDVKPALRASLKVAGGFFSTMGLVLGSVLKFAIWAIPGAELYGQYVAKVPKYMRRAGKLMTNVGSPLSDESRKGISKAKGSKFGNQEKDA